MSSPKNTCMGGYVHTIAARFLCQHEKLSCTELATEWERQLTTAHADQTTGLTNGRVANWAPEVVFSPFRTLSRRQLTFPSCC